MKSISIVKNKISQHRKFIPTLLLIMVFICNNMLFPQDAVIQWENTIGGNQGDNPTSIESTSDGGFILGCFSGSGISADKTDSSRGGNDYWIIKLDAMGNIQWQKTIGGSGDDRLYSAKQTMDGGYILAGYSNSGISGEKTEACLGGYDYWVIKLNSAGNIIAQNTLGGIGDDYLYTVWETTSAPNNFILGGSSNSNSSPDKTENCLGGFDYWLLRVGITLAPVWNNTVGGTGNDYLSDLTPKHSDPTFIRVAGYSDSNISADKMQNSFGGEDYYIVGIDIATGTLTNNRTFGGSGNEQIFSIINTIDNGLILTGYSNSNMSGSKTENSYGGYDFWIIKTDENYNILWQNTIGGSGDDYAIDAVQKNPGEIVVGGAAQSPFSSDMLQDCQAVDYWLIGLNNSSGANMWQNTLVGSYDEFFSSMCYTPGSLVMTGASNSNQSFDKSEDQIGDYDSWVVRIYAQGCINPSWSSASLVDSIICLGESVTVQFSGILNSSLFWTTTNNDCSPATGSGVSNMSGFSFLPSDTGTFSMQVGPMGVCYLPITCDSIGFTVVNVPSVSFNILEDDQCINSGNILLIGTPTGGLFGGPGVTTNLFDPAAAGPGMQHITYTYTDSLGCVASSTDSIIVNDIPLVSFNIPHDSICITSGMITLSGMPATGIFNGPGVTTNLFDPSAAGSGNHLISYTYIDSMGCEVSVDDSIWVTTCLGIDQQNENWNVSVYPNPGNGSFTLTLKNLQLSQELPFQLITTMGQVIHSGIISNQMEQFNFNYLAPGTYYLMITNDEKQIRKPVIIQ